MQKSWLVNNRRITVLKKEVDDLGICSQRRRGAEAVCPSSAWRAIQTAANGPLQSSFSSPVSSRSQAMQNEPRSKLSVFGLL